MLWDMLFEIGGQSLIDFVSNILYPLIEALGEFGIIFEPFLT